MGRGWPKIFLAYSFREMVFHTLKLSSVGADVRPLSVCLLSLSISLSSLYVCVSILGYSNSPSLSTQHS